MTKKKILFIATGGTFASINTTDGLKPGFNIEELLSFFPEAKEIAEIDGIQLCNLDSTNVHPQHWTEIANTISQNYDKYEGFIISHGTDTMQYSAAALSFALKGIAKPVVLTGSVYSISEIGSDAKMNFIDSVRVASSDLIKEVCVCFHHDIIKGTRVSKITNEATNIINEKMGVFSSINLHFVGTVDVGKIIDNKIYFTKNGYLKNPQLELLSKFNLSVGHIKLYPGLESDILEGFKNKKAILIEAFGPGNVPFDYSDWLEKIQKLSNEGVSVFVTTQNPFGEVDMEKYEVGQLAMKAGAIPCYDMLPGTALVKLMWILGNFPNYNSEEINKLFLTNICGEILNVKR